MEDIKNSINKVIVNDEHKLPKKIIIIAFFIMFSLLFIGYFNLEKGDNFPFGDVVVTNGDEMDEKERAQRNMDAYYLSLLQNNPIELQNLFLDDIKKGVNDEYTKSSIYFITHRFFDNGGDIYEIYDYVNSHQELAFLKEAEIIYPMVFGEIKKKNKNITYRQHLYAYCAYIEVLTKYGYADIASLGTVANQYAKLAFFSKTILSLVDVSEKERLVREEWFKKNVEKSLKYLALAEGDIKKILDGKITSDDIPHRDILVGLNQYAATLRYLEASGIKASTTLSAKNIFLFSSEYSHKHVKELTLFTAFLDASTLVLLSSSTQQEIKIALYQILDFDTKKIKNSNPNFNLGIIGKIIDSRFQVSLNIIQDEDLDIYSKRNILLLAKKSPEFKKWLRYNGWEDSDFKY